MNDTTTTIRRAGGARLWSESIWAGVVLWMALGVALVLARGIRWDEHDKFAAVLLGRVDYPEAHPLVIMTHYVRNLPIFLSTAVAWAFPGPEAVNGYRNVLWMWSTTLPVYLIASRLSGRVLAGHVAAALALTGSYTAFVTNYPLSPWPMYYSNGHVGRGVGLLILYFALAGRYRTAWLMLGFMPMIHGSQGLFVGLLLSVAALVRMRTNGVGVVARDVVWFLPGAACVVALWFVPGLTLPVATEGPYASAVAAPDILRAYMATEPLFAPPGTALSYTNGTIVLALALFLCIAAAGNEWRETRKVGPWLWLSVYFALVSAAVWTIMIVHRAMGDEAPYLLIAWMPYRFTNHGAVILPAMLAAIAAAPRRGTGNVLAGAALVMFAALPLLDVILPAGVYDRYVASGEGMLFALAGGCAVLVLSRINTMGPFYVTWVMAACAGVTVLALHHQFGAFCLLAGFSLTVVYGQVIRHQSPGIALARYSGRLVTAALVILGISIVLQEGRARETLPVSAFEAEASRIIRDEAGPNARVVARPDDHGLQCRLGLAVLADDATATDMVYVPRIAPSTQALLDALYGIRFFPPRDDPRPWTTVWAERAPDGWRALGRAYGFEHVIAPNTVPLDLPVALEGARETLYRVTASGP